MSAAPNINFQAVASIIVACIAATPPILTATTNIAIQIRERTQKRRTAGLKVLSITRTPASQENWQKVKRNFLIGSIVPVGLALFIAVNTLLYRFDYGYFTLSRFGIVGKPVLGFEINVFVLLNFLFGCYYAIAFRKAYKRMGNKAYQARHFLFEKALLVVEADVTETTDKCRETLRLLGAQVIEVKLESLSIEGYTNHELVTAFGGLYRIKLSEEISKSIHTFVEVKFLSHPSDKTTKITSSSNTNRFIRTFIGN